MIEQSSNRNYRFEIQGEVFEFVVTHSCVLPCTCDHLKVLQDELEALLLVIKSAPKSIRPIAPRVTLDEILNPLIG